MNQTTILITGAAGFIGANTIKQILKRCSNSNIIGIDNMNSYYDVSLKKYRLMQIEQAFDANKERNNSWVIKNGAVSDAEFIKSIFEKYEPSVVVNLAAQAGVRYSIDHPDVFMESNVMGFYQILEACRHSYDDGKSGVQHLIYASSSSVYGDSQKVPYSTEDRINQPVSLYAATKITNELLAYSYSKLYNIPTTGLRFFTVYGPAGRPDMAYFSFADKLKKGEKIQIYNYGNCKRDFTYIDDIVEGICRVLQHAPERIQGEDGLPVAPHKLYNIGNGHPVSLLDFVEILQQELVRAGVLPDDYDFEAHKELLPMQPGDVVITYADTKPLETDFDFRPKTSLQEGLRKFAEWYAEYCTS
ncbi:MAG: GDP-mannose 4,6-dehydratase [Lachnospiraceae bacterium]|nr:GDP-mannose 4,6-dehydratase [Lachnospiraceae bacterium]